MLSQLINFKQTLLISEGSLIAFGFVLFQADICVVLYLLLLVPKWWHQETYLFLLLLSLFTIVLDTPCSNCSASRWHSCRLGADFYAGRISTRSTKSMADLYTYLHVYSVICVCLYKYNSQVCMPVSVELIRLWWGRRELADPVSIGNVSNTPNWNVIKLFDFKCQSSKTMILRAL